MSPEMAPAISPATPLETPCRTVPRAVSPPAPPAPPRRRARGAWPLRRLPGALGLALLGLIALTQIAGAQIADAQPVSGRSAPDQATDQATDPAPRHAPPPPLRAPGDYLANEETAIFNGPPAAVARAVQSPAHGVLAHVRATERIPQVIGTSPISGRFPAAGAIRQVNLEGGYTATERMIENGAQGFRYQVWDLTAPAARQIDHILGEFRYRALPDGRTEVTWRYAVAPRRWLARPFIARFLARDFAPFMRSGLDGAAAHFNAARGG